MKIFFNYLFQLEIIEQVKTRNLRPDQPKLLDNDADPAILTLMSECWKADPNLRPDISTVLKRLRQQNKGKYVLCFQSQKLIWGNRIRYLL